MGPSPEQLRAVRACAGCIALVGATLGCADHAGNSGATDPDATAAEVRDAAYPSDTTVSDAAPADGTLAEAAPCPAPAAPDGEGNWYVDGRSGDDCGPGTLAAPFKTIQRCATIARAGQSCVLRAGTYRETVAPANDGTASAPITFRPFAGEVVTVSGADAVPAALWSAESASVWVATVGLASASRRFEAQVFVGGEMWVEARWPNLDDATHLLDHGGEATAGSGTTASASGGSIVSVAGLPPGCTDTSLSNATIRVRGGLNWFAHSGQVSAVNGSTIAYVETANAENLATKTYAGMYATVGPTDGSRFYLTGAMCLLDAANEWAFDEQAGKLRLWSSGSPGDGVEVKRRDWAFDLRGRSGITIDGVRLFAAGITTGDTSTDVTLRRLDARYLSHFVKIEDPWGGSYADTGIVLRGKGNTIEDSAIDWSAGNGVALLGQSSTVHNCTIQHIDYAAIYASPVVTHPYGGDGTNSGHTITQNTIRYAGRDGITAAEGCPDNGAGWVGWQHGRIALNEISDYGMLNQDLGGIYFSCQDGYGTHIDHNRIHDTACRDARGFAGAASSVALYFDFASKNFAVHHNVVWNAGGACISMNGTKGGAQGVGSTGLTFNNNTCGANTDASVTAFNMGSMAGTYFSNNIFMSKTADDHGNVLCYETSGCPSDAAICPAYGAGGACNLTSKPSPGFRDESTWCDYHLASGSPAIDTGAPVWTDTSPVDNLIVGVTDYGAYESGGYDFTPGPVCAGAGSTL